VSACWAIEEVYVGRLSEKVAIVTGAGQGIGRGIALAFAEEGAKVVVAELEPERGQRTAAELAARGTDATFVHCDVSQRESIDACVASTLRAFGRIDILVNNAVHNGPLLSFDDHDASVWTPAIETGLLGTFHFMQACRPHLRERGGRVINLGSMAGYQGWEKCTAYAAVKEGIRALSKVAAREWGPDGITVNVITPFANSPGWVGYVEEQPEAAQAQLDGTPLRRIGDCEDDVGRAAVFLASDDAAYVTGHTLPVDGGYAIIA
jgi:NAD(P)-dependent dehydrogenase (short-subunit alcohol dehydrogenase family)